MISNNINSSTNDFSNQVIDNKNDSSKENMQNISYTSAQKYMVIQSTQAPYSSSASIDALEAALAASNIGVKVVYVFSKQGVLQLMNNQEASAIGHKSTYKRLQLLPLYDVEDIYIDKQAVADHAVDLQALEFSYTLVDFQAVEALCNKASHVLVF